MKRLMGQIPIVQVNVTFDPLPGFSGALVILKIDFIVLQTTPEALNRNVIRRAALAVHADQHLVFLEQLNVLWTGKMAALIAVDDVRPLKRQCSFHRLQHKANLQRLIQLPIDDEPRIPVDDGKQIHPPVLHPDVGNVN